MMTNDQIPIDRRHFLSVSGAAAAGLWKSAAAMGDAQVLLPQGRTHHAPRAKRFMMIFLTGGMSHVDTFDPKPELTKRHGQNYPGFGIRGTANLPLLKSPFAFRKCGESSTIVSELFTELPSVVDDICVIRSLKTDIVEHFQATLAMHTGSSTVPMPSIGSWLGFALGTDNPNLPAYVTFCEHLPYAGAQLWDSVFLPPEFQGVRIVPGPEPIADLKPPEDMTKPEAVTLRELENRFLDRLNAHHADLRPDDARLKGRMNNNAVARGLQREAPEAFDTGLESGRTLERYGVAEGDRKSFGAQCLIARRLLERGVRCVEIIDTGASDNWDSHGDMQAHRPKAARVDKAITALLQDIKARGMWDDTLIAICTEFGRTPWGDGPNSPGRNHLATAFTCILAGGGVKGGMTYGETDEFGVNVVKDQVHVHDYHATILHILGLDHTKVTYRYAGRDFRLTDVFGKVVQPILT
jgi:hypothetical protein